MSIETEIQKTIEGAIQRAMEAKGGPLLGLPILALLVGAPMIKSREATLIETLLGMVIGSMIDRGDSDEKIRGKFEETLRAIRSAFADPALTERREGDRRDARSVALVDLSDQERFVTPPAAGFIDLILDNARRMSTLRAVFSARGTELVNTYQHGSYKIVALFVVDTNSYWEMTAQASRAVSWTQDALNAWLREELVRQLDAWCAARAESA